MEVNNDTLITKTDRTGKREFRSVYDNYRLMHALFHIKTVIIPRDRYRPEGFSPRVDIGWGMITVLIWKKACINLFITYFNIELKRTKLTSHTDTKLMNMSDRYRLRVLLPKCQQICPRWTSTFSKRQLTVGRKWRRGAHERLWYRVIRVSPRWQISLWHFRCLCMDTIDVITYKYVIIYYYLTNTCITVPNTYMSQTNVTNSYIMATNTYNTVTTTYFSKNTTYIN
jgi:hypothetical protein